MAMMNLTREQKVRRAKLLKEKIRRNKLKVLARTLQSFYDWQNRFNAATAKYRACALMAANQVGKSRTGCTIDAAHITGDYPENWQGHKFEKPIVAWLLGYSGEKTRDLLQHKIFGRLEKNPDTGRMELSGGLIPKERIIGYRSMSGTVGAVREVVVKHASGGKSICQFWSYTQGQHALMGDVVDWYHIDEEPEDKEIFPQVVTRTLNGDQGRGGRGILTFTPENGKTQLVRKFMDEPDEGMYLQTATWDDAPHLTEETKRTILAMYPAYQRDMRSRGIPLMGAGLIYEHSEDSIRCAPFMIPDHWLVINGHDIGWDHPTAHVQIVIDPDENCFYVTKAYRERKKAPFEVWEATKIWAANAPVAWPGDGLQHKQQGEGKEAIEHYRLYQQAGFTMLHEPATHPDGGNGVWAGIRFIDGLMETGKFKVFSHLHEVFEEIREYHTKTTGADDENITIVKIKDDLVDAIRYAIMMRRFAKPMKDVRAPKKNERRQRQARDWRAA